MARAIAGASPRRATHVVDTSTIGLAAAQGIDDLLSAAGIAYVDAPVSGGVAGARARTLSVMYAGRAQACESVEPVLAGLSDRRRRVGDRPGMAQALKLANNFLSATALAATSEAVAFGISVGLDMGTMVEVLNASSGQSAATSDKFPNHVLTGRYAAGFANSLMSKDLKLYLGSRGRAGRSGGHRQDHRVGVGALRHGGTGGGLHPHLPVCRAGADGDGHPPCPGPPGHAAPVLGEPGGNSAADSHEYGRSPGLEVVPMRVVVDFDLCESNALCMGLAPEVFEVRDDDLLYVLDENPPEGLREKVEAAVRTCPKNAISIED